MGVLLTKRFKFESLNGRIQFLLKVSVNKDGDFTSYYPEHAQEFLEKRFVQLRRGRANRKGYISSNSLDSFNKIVEEDFDKALECEVVEESVVIKYKIKASAAFCVDNKNNVFPNGTFKKDSYWYQSKQKVDAINKAFYGITVYAQLYRKTTYGTVEGLKNKYKYITSNDAEVLGEEACKLASWVGMKHDEYDDDNINELYYTEENAKFFNSLLCSICELTIKIDKFSDPQDLQKLISTKQKLLQ